MVSKQSEIPNLKPKVLIIVGPTSSGKSELAVRLTKRFNGEIISADSRQIYQGMDLGTGKVPGKWKTNNFHGRENRSLYIYKGIRHHLIDFVNPKRQYSVSLFQKKTQKAIADIARRGRLPVICGGTAHWIDAVVYKQQIPDVKPDLKLRRRLEKLSTDGLFARISRLDPNRAKIIDRHNRRRLVRALEIVLTTKKPVPNLSTVHYCPLSTFNALWIGITQPQDVLYQRIEKRLKRRLKAGMIKEIQKLHKQGLSWRRLETFGLEYRFGALYLQKKISHEEMLKQMLLANKHYAKRQLTWWKRNKNIHWITAEAEARKLIEKFKDGE
ncbi:MAG: tRNA (adenosine(37)-N6)-dimethylallyltransferase MiaA [Patescibacteria group bacterium]|nr:tRNA (adenosine(37)-N6)-dimethylallyltransferase MiaA [Patescibacteria group bacterium]